MKEQKVCIDICVGTYKRPELLRLLLRSLKGQQLGKQISMRIIIIDNDSEQSAETAVENFKNENSIPVIYEVEPLQGISYVRNRALQHINAEYIAFLDDDEVAAPNWLLTLYEALLHYNADIVFGPVHSMLPENIPEWALAHPSFNRTKKKTGTLKISGATNNVLLRKDALGSPQQEFDPTFALTGGGDSEFFHKLYLAGKKLVWCEEAIVHEHIPLTRISIAWVRKRAFRGGQCFRRTFVSRYSIRKKVLWLLTKPLQLLAGLVAMPFVRLYSYPQFVRILCKVASATGQLTGSVKVLRYQEYTKHNIITSNNKH